MALTFASLFRCGPNAAENRTDIDDKAGFVFTQSRQRCSQNALNAKHVDVEHLGRVCSVVMLLFWRKGYNPTSISDLRKATGVSAPGLSAAFGNKEDLYVEAVQLYMRASQSLFRGYLDAGRTARAGMRDLLRATAKDLSCGDSHPIGCFVTLATVDEDMPASVSKAIRKARREWLGVIRAHIERALVNGELPPSTDVRTNGRDRDGSLASTA
jgi:AcrR family transcriptional regulator